MSEQNDTTQTVEHLEEVNHAAQATPNHLHYDGRIASTQGMVRKQSHCNSGSFATPMGADDQTADGAGQETKRRKRDRVMYVLRKMLPGAGVVTGLTLLGERIWEIVENVE